MVARRISHPRWYSGHVTLLVSTSPEGFIAAFVGAKGTAPFVAHSSPRALRFRKRCHWAHLSLATWPRWTPGLLKKPITSPECSFAWWCSARHTIRRPLEPERAAIQEAPPFGTSEKRYVAALADGRSSGVMPLDATTPVSFGAFLESSCPACAALWGSGRSGTGDQRRCAARLAGRLGGSARRLGSVGGLVGARNMPSLRWADTGPVAWRPPRCRGAVVWRCNPPGGRAVLSEVCGRFKSAFARFRHAAPRNQHPRSRVSSRRLREIDPRLGGSSAAAPDEYGWPPQ